MLSKKKSFTLIGIFIFVLCFWVLRNLLSTPSENCLILGTMSGWPPYVTVNDKGVYEGLDIDVAQELARRMGKTLVIQDMETAALICALEQGKVDIILTGLDITPSRLKKIAMIPYQGEAITSFPLVFWQSVPEGVTSINDLIKDYPDAIICVEPGSSQEPLLNNYPKHNIKQIDPLLAVLELKYGKARTILMGPTLYQEYKKNYKELVSLAIEIDDDNKTFGCGIGIKKDNSRLITEIDALIKELKAEGFISVLENKWFKGQQ